ncbi:MAG: hypothetical protein GY804_15010 [Alphaproteobacteria bacterium]|nr:hypothetical protein [Alphaproteobacteria bacterium]
MKKILLVLSALLFIGSNVQAGFLINMGGNKGGDDVTYHMGGTWTAAPAASPAIINGDVATAGTGDCYFLGLGYEFSPIPAMKQFELQFAGMYLSGSESQYGSKIEVNKWCFEGIAFYNLNDIRVGIGASIHAEIEVDITGGKDSLFGDQKHRPDDAIGAVIALEYIVRPFTNKEVFLTMGVKYTIMDYKNNGETFNTDTVGFNTALHF